MPSRKDDRGKERFVGQLSRDDDGEGRRRESEVHGLRSVRRDARSEASSQSAGEPEIHLELFDALIDWTPTRTCDLLVDERPHGVLEERFTPAIEIGQGRDPFEHAVDRVRRVAPLELVEVLDDELPSRRANRTLVHHQRKQVRSVLRSDLGPAQLVHLVGKTEVAQVGECPLVAPLFQGGARLTEAIEDRVELLASSVRSDGRIDSGSDVRLDLASRFSFGLEQLASSTHDIMVFGERAERSDEDAAKERDLVVVGAGSNKADAVEYGSQYAAREIGDRLSIDLRGDPVDAPKSSDGE